MSGSIRDRLKTAAAFLREAEQYDSASAVEAVLAPRGYRLLEEKRGGASTLSLGMTEHLKQALVAAGEEFDVVFSGLVEEAYQAVVERGWVPPEAPRVRRGTGGARTVLNVSIDAELRKRVQEMLPALSAKAGYRVLETNIAVTYICDQLGVQRPNTSKAAVNTRIPKTLLAHFESQAAARGTTLPELVEAGVADLVSGVWQMPRSPHAGVSRQTGRKWTEADRAWLIVHLRPDTMDDLTAMCEDLSAEYERMVYPGAVVRAILTDRLGEPAE